MRSMPSTARRSKASLWLRVAGACLALAVVAAGLVAFEVTVFGLVSYGVFRFALGLAEHAPIPHGLVTVLVVLGYAGAATVVFAAYRVATDQTPGETVTKLLVYVSALLVFASLAATYLAIQFLGLPGWTFFVVVAMLLASVYPMMLLQFARGESDDDSGVWTVEDTEDPPSKVEEVRAVAAELWRGANATADRLGPAGSVLVVAFAVAALRAVAVLAEARSPSDLALPLAVAAGGGLALAHLGGLVRSELRETAVLDDLTDDLGRVVDDERAAALTERVARLATQADVPVPAVRLVTSRTPTAAAVGYRPADSTLVVSTGLYDTLDDRQLDAVLAHELAHVANHDAAVLTALSFPRAAAHRAFYRYGLNPVVALLAGVAALTSRTCTAVVARAREYGADDGAVALTGDPAALASALEALDSTLGRRPATDLRESSAAAFSIVPPPWEEHPFFDRTRRLIYRGLLGTHPPTDARIERLRAVERERETERG
jgi:heat shock protein HtpX